MPAFQFYPADWRKDPGVQALNRHDRSVWFDMLCIMHESDERGVLLLAGRPMPEAALAAMLGLDNQIFNQTLTTILTYGVASRRESDGAIYCRRMVKDEGLCQLRREAGKKGGNPNLVNQKGKQKPTTQVNQIPTPSSSITSSSNEEEREANSSSSATHLKAELGGQALVAGPAADPAKAAALATTDLADEQPWQESPLTKPVPFQVICDRHPFGKGIAYEHYRQLALAAVEGTDTARTIKQWQSWIFKFLENQKPKNGQLLTLADLARENQTGVRAPQHPNAPNHKPRPEVQAKRDADFEAQKQLRIAANLARNAADGLSQQTQPGGVARTF